MGTGLTSGLMALLIAFVLGFGAAWIWRGKRLTILEGQASRLRRDRRTLAHRLSQANGRLDSANYNRAKIQDNANQLQAKHDALEAEHARLVVNYANLKSGVKGIVGEDDWFEDFEPDDVAEAVSSPQEAGPKPVQQTIAQPTINPDRAAPPPQKTLDDSLMADTVPLENNGADSADPTLTGPSTISGPTRSDRGPDTQAAARDRALKDLEAFEAQLSAASRSIGDDRPFIGAQDLSPPAEGSDALREQLSRQQAEITRLQEQLRPLLGLPLAVSAREAERDRLAERLAARDREMNEMTTALDQLARSERELREEVAKMRKKADDKVDKKKKRKKTFTQSAQRAQLRTPPPAAAETQPGSMSAVTSHGLNDRESTPANGDSDSLVTNALPWRDMDAGDDTKSLAAGIGPTLPGPIPAAPRQYQQVPGQVDNLKEIKGIGPVLERLLNQLGVYQFRQIASWSEQDIAYFDDHLADFRGRIKRDDWVAGAQLANARKNR